ncbi:MAG: sulfur carrier protein ThiS [Candidatus Eremiobacteraeota bacterium]|nr:sulfur carrier protein ThiS [Candidatus Eremiobacteraeota bacterium]
MKASINGRVHELPDSLTVRELLERVGSRLAGVAVARNDRVVRRGDYDAARIEEGDRIEIIQAVAGG